jgi:hypothetical protein
MNELFINKRRIEVSGRAEVLELALALVAIVAVSLLLPLLSIPINNQFIAGPVVNCALIVAGINFRGWIKTSAIIFAPSVAALIGGLIIAPLSTAMLYMIPAIWLGNAVIVLAFKYLYAHRRVNFVLTAILAVGAKVAIIFAFFSIYVSSGIISGPPAVIMSTVMGINQLITATIGAVLAFGIIKVAYPKSEYINKSNSSQ